MIVLFLVMGSVSYAHADAKQTQNGKHESLRKDTQLGELIGALHKSFNNKHWVDASKFLDKFEGLSEALDAQSISGALAKEAAETLRLLLDAFDRVQSGQSREGDVAEIRLAIVTQILQLLLKAQAENKQLFSYELTKTMAKRLGELRTFSLGRGLRFDDLAPADVRRRNIEHTITQIKQGVFENEAYAHELKPFKMAIENMFNLLGDISKLKEPAFEQLLPRAVVSDLERTHRRTLQIIDRLQMVADTLAKTGHISPLEKDPGRHGFSGNVNRLFIEELESEHLFKFLLDSHNTPSPEHEFSVSALDKLIDKMKLALGVSETKKNVTSQKVVFNAGWNSKNPHLKRPSSNGSTRQEKRGKMHGRYF